MHQKTVGAPLSEASVDWICCRRLQILAVWGLLRRRKRFGPKPPQPRGRKQSYPGGGLGGSDPVPGRLSCSQAPILSRLLTEAVVGVPRPQKGNCRSHILETAMIQSRSHSMGPESTNPPGSCGAELQVPPKLRDLRFGSSGGRGWQGILPLLPLSQQPAALKSRGLVMEASCNAKGDAHPFEDAGRNPRLAVGSSAAAARFIKVGACCACDKPLAQPLAALRKPEQRCYGGDLNPTPSILTPGHAPPQPPQWAIGPSPRDPTAPHNANF